MPSENRKAHHVKTFATTGRHTKFVWCGCGGSCFTVASQQLVETVLQVQLGRFRLHRLHLDGNMLVVVEVFAEPQLAKVATSYLLADPKIRANHQHTRSGIHRVSGRLRLATGALSCAQTQTSITNHHHESVIISHIHKRTQSGNRFTSNQVVSGWHKYQQFLIIFLFCRTSSFLNSIGAIFKVAYI